MVALAEDWRVVEERAFYFLTPSRVLNRWRSIFGDDAPVATHKEMVASIIECDALEEDLSEFIRD
jgi:hypothetical protein